jgi:hypothetical protein
VARHLSLHNQGITAITISVQQQHYPWGEIMGEKTRVPFIRRGGEQIYQQPFDALGVQFYGFMLAADTHSIQTRLCDRYLNEPSGGAVNFAPFGPWFMLVFNNLGRLSSAKPPDSERGWFTERESAAWVLLEEKKSGKLYWFLPYIMVDNSYALCMGRETYGFPKSLGCFEIPYFPEYATYFSVGTIVVPAYSKTTQGVWETLWEAAKKPGASHGFEPLEDLTELVKAAEGALKRTDWPHDLWKLLQFLHQLLAREVPMTFLKQLPSIEDPTLASYQAITQTVIKMTDFHGGSLLGNDFRIDIHDYDSHPVRQDLGLPAGNLSPFLSFYANFDFLVGNGRTLWEAR